MFAPFTAGAMETHWSRHGCGQTIKELANLGLDVTFVCVAQPSAHFHNDGMVGRRHGCKVYGAPNAEASKAGEVVAGIAEAVANRTTPSHSCYVG